MNPAQATRLEKEKHPERFCPKCLWRIVTTKGPNPCRKHPNAATATPAKDVTAVTAGAENEPLHNAEDTTAQRI